MPSLLDGRARVALARVFAQSPVHAQESKSSQCLNAVSQNQRARSSEPCVGRPGWHKASPPSRSAGHGVPKQSACKLHQPSRSHPDPRQRLHQPAPLQEWCAPSPCAPRGCRPGLPRHRSGTRCCATSPPNLMFWPRWPFAHAPVSTSTRVQVHLCLTCST